MKRVLVTGAVGFIGRACLPLLISGGYEVHAVSSRPSVPGQGVWWHTANLLEPGVPAALIDSVAPSHLLHLAWYTEPGRYWTNPANGLWANATIQLGAAFYKRGGYRAVYAGTCAEYDWTHGGICDETTTPVVPATLYGRCKRATWDVLEALALESGTSAAWARLFFLYGPHERPERLVPSVVRALLASERARCTSGEQVRDFLYVEDVAKAFVALIDYELQGAVNIGSGQPTAVREVLSVLGAKLGGSQLIEFGALPNPSEDVPRLVADVTKLKRGTGWAPTVDIEQGLERTIAWWREQS